MEKKLIAIIAVVVIAVIVIIFVLMMEGSSWAGTYLDTASNVQVSITQSGNALTINHPSGVITATVSNGSISAYGTIGKLVNNNITWANGNVWRRV